MELKVKITSNFDVFVRIRKVCVAQHGTLINNQSTYTHIQTYINIHIYAYIYLYIERETFFIDGYFVDDVGLVEENLALIVILLFAGNTGGTVHRLRRRDRSSASRRGLGQPATRSGGGALGGDGLRDSLGCWLLKGCGFQKFLFLPMING